jgi:hypothetical protein
MSFTSDGVAFSSIQGEVKSAGPVGTPAHGSWAYLGGRRYAFTTMIVVYNINTGDLQGFGKVRALLTIDKRGNRMNASVTVDILDPNGNPGPTFPHTVSFTRIRVERPD